jgi:histidinol phosphatase-like PHP family hydrolase
LIAYLEKLVVYSFASIEANILPDGSIDISEDAAKHLDYVIAAFIGMWWA